MPSSPFTREKMALRMRNLPFFKYMIAIAALLWVLQVAFPAWRIIPIWDLHVAESGRLWQLVGPDTVPLHYNIHFGVDTIGSWWRIFTVPVIGLALLLVNILMAKILWTKEEMLSYLVVSATVLLEFLLFLAMVFIVILNIRYG